MKLDCVITSCNLNNLYFDFIPLFIKSWNKLYPNVDVKIILISNYIPNEIEQYKNNIILFSPIDNISTAFTSQYIRLLYPCILNYNNGILITDMDMIPMNSTYYTENIKNINDDKFIYYRDALIYQYKEIAMCYNIALNKTWKDVFNINNVEDIKQRIINVNNNINYVEGHGTNGWTTDQTDLYKYIINWNKKTNNFVFLDDKKTGYNRLDRGTFNLDDNEISKIKNGFYTDYHCYRPYKQYKQINDAILDLL